MASPKEQTLAPQEEFRQDTDHENPGADLEPHDEILGDNPAELDQPDEQNALRDSPNEDDLLRARAETLRTLLDDEPTLENEDSDADEFPALARSRIEHVKVAQQFIDEISAATFDNGKLDADVIEHLRRPEEGPVDISNPDIRLALDLFMACDNASQQTYTAARQSILRRFPESEILSYHLVKKLVADISGVVSVKDDMCINSCHAFTGPFALLDACSICSEPRYDPVQFGLTGKKVP